MVALLGLGDTIAFTNVTAHGAQIKTGVRFLTKKRANLNVNGAEDVLFHSGDQKTRPHIIYHATTTK